MQFKKFTSLENTYKDKLINDLHQQGLSGGEWVILEKVDGCNIAIYYDGESFKIASRNQFVNESFFNCGPVIENYKEHIKRLYELVDCDHIIVRGELYGDGIQNRVKYGPKDFVSFEIDVVKDGNLTTMSFSWMLSAITDTATGLSISETLLIAPIIKRSARFAEAMETSPDFRSKLTPADHEGDNWSEGVVILPDEPKYFASGSRVFFKNKSDLFKEKGAKKHQLKEAIVLDEYDSKRVDDVIDLMTESRVYSAASKIGEIKPNMFGILLKEFMQDVHTDFEKEYGCTYLEGVTEAKEVKSIVSREGAATVREVFKTLI